QSSRAADYGVNANLTTAHAGSFTAIHLWTCPASPVKVIKWPKKLEKLRISVPSASMFLG
ncbi:MAG TPA: hypothetical protein PLR25_10015, partial [Planctomycetaceae bacterium]|nr:hypothetical protein [Planctomycetaceae bacterium]